MKQAGGISHKITMQAFLHQITHADAMYRKTATVVNIQKPPNARSSVCYLTFTDEGACVQTKIEMQQKRIPAEMWIQSLIQQCRGLEIMDVWNLQETAFDGNHRTYQISVRVPGHLGTCKLQRQLVNVCLRTGTARVSKQALRAVACLPDGRQNHM